MLQKVGRTLFDCLLLGSMVDDVISDLLCLGVETHDGLLKNVLLIQNIGSLAVKSLSFILGLTNRVVKHRELFLKPSSLIHDIGLSLLEELLITPHLL